MDEATARQARAGARLRRRRLAAVDTRRRELGPPDWRCRPHRPMPRTSDCWRARTPCAAAARAARSRRAALAGAAGLVVALGAADRAVGPDHRRWPPTCSTATRSSTCWRRRPGAWWRGTVVVYVALAVAALRRPVRDDGPASGLRGAVLGWWQRALGDGPLRVAARRWAELSAPLMLTRVAGAAARGRGGGGDRAGGQHVPARPGARFPRRLAKHVSRQRDRASAAGRRCWRRRRRVTGIGVPDAAAIEAMRLTSPAQRARASAAPWIHLYGATLALAVVVPRLALALVALGRVR